jgi:ribosomal protein S18 acetylase RimI-like enzyme
VIVGQLWIDLAKRAEFSAGVLWALYIAPEMRGQGIGSQLLASAEERLRERRYEFAEIGAERDNPAARRLYERLGYRLVCEDIAEYAVTAPDGTPGHVTVDQWVLSKKLMR